MKLTIILDYLCQDLADVIEGYYEDYVENFENGEPYDDIFTYVDFQMDELYNAAEYEISNYITAAIKNCGQSIGQIIDENDLDNVEFNNFNGYIGTIADLVYEYLKDVMFTYEFINEIKLKLKND